MNEETLFELARNTPEAERVALFDQHCAGNPALRARVEALLKADAQTLGYRPDPLGTQTFHQPIGEAGQIVAGKYSLVEVIGEGGMGSVWRAKQTEPVKRFVAVKLIKAGMDSKAVLARFEAERQALAVMDHPNIAKILDGGLHENRPFFVMELVKGVPITTYCDANKLTPKQRLELFVPVCQAIQHAHQKGIIHRDIKPSNVMVALYDDKPVVKVIDFGIAKATVGTLTEQTIDTGFGGVVGTPQYMSPEQASLNNTDIDTRSDVYSLGVLLYELLTGSPPFARKDLQKAGLLEILRVVREEEPPRPSTKLSTADALPSLSANRGTEPKKLTGLLRNELDWIVMKALEKDRTRRYETANGFAADVNRYLSGEAVLAHPPSTAYRLKKFVKRNKVQVIAAGLVLAVLVAGVVGTTLGLLEAKQARADEAKRADSERDARKEADEKSVEADIQRRAAEDQRTKAVAAAKAEEAARKKEAVERIHAEAIAEFVREDFFALTSLEGQTRFAGSSPVALNQNLTLRQMLDRAADKLDKRTDLAARTEADLRWMIGVNYRGQGAYDRAEVQLERCLTLRKKILPAHHRDVLSALNSLAMIHGMTGRLERSIVLLEEVIEVMKATFGMKNRDTLIAMNNLAVAYRRTGKYPEAVGLFERIVEAEKELYGHENPVTVDNLALAYRNERRFDLAVSCHKRAIEAFKDRYTADHLHTLTAMNNLASTYIGAGETDEALKVLEQVVKVTEDKFSVNSPESLRSQANLAVTCWSLGRLDRSVPLFEESLRRHEAVFGRQAASTQMTVANLGVNYKDAGRLKEAIPLLEEAHLASKKNPEVQFVTTKLLEAYAKAGETEKHSKLLKEYLTDTRRTIPKESPQLAGFLAQVSMSLMELKKWSYAEQLLREALAIREKTQPDIWTTFNTQSMTGAALLGQKKYADAEPLLLKGYEGMKQREKTIPPQGSTRIPEAIDRLIELYTATNNQDEFKKWQEVKNKLPKPKVAPMPKPVEKK